jgi:hypothetical protein
MAGEGDAVNLGHAHTLARNGRPVSPKVHLICFAIVTAEFGSGKD